MNGKKQFSKYLIAGLSAFFFMTISIINPMYYTSLAEVNTDVYKQTISQSQVFIDLPSIEVEKLVWDDFSWVNSVIVNEDEIVTFRVSIYNPYDNYIIHFSGKVLDILPCNLQYINGSSTIYEIEGGDDWPNLEEVCWDDNTVIWHKPPNINPHEYLNFTYQALSVCCGSDFEVNNLTVVPDYLIHVCNSSDIIENDGSLNVSDSAFVKVICSANPQISLEKKVKDDGYWVDSVTVSKGDNIEFRIVVTNNGSINLTSILVIDTLPFHLVYNYDSNITPSSFSDHQITWTISQIDVGESIEIVFSAKAVDVGEGYNTATVSCCQGVSDSDSVYILVSGMIVSKKVWDDTLDLWLDEKQVSVGDIIRFRIMVSYVGDGIYSLYNIRVRDELPECLEYADNAVPVETAISNDGKTIWWNLTISIPPTSNVSIEFDALVTETSGCGPCINLANVTANECSGQIFYGEDTVTITAECPLIANVNGPYYGKINQAIYLEASATGGSPPYIYKWDLDDDGLFDDHIGKSLSTSWDKDGIYPIHVKVTDSQLRTYVDSTVVIIEPADNQAPQIPSKPQGNTIGSAGVSYYYMTSSIDQNDDLIRYGWDWTGDGIVDEWTGFYSSGTLITVPHVWSSAGTYTIRVKAEDQHGAKSGFSDALTVIISENSAPLKPSLSGPTNGRINTAYTYSAVGVDPDGDNIYFWFDWGNGVNSGWIGPYSSGQTASVSHSWDVRGSYPIKVKTKDISGAESVWSDPLQVSMPKTYNFDLTNFSDILQWILHYFPFLYLYSYFNFK